MATPHKHADLIKAWADGAEIQAKSMISHTWVDVQEPSWSPEQAYRIKPKEPIVVRKAVVPCTVSGGNPLVHWSAYKDNNVCFTFDPDSGELLSVEKI